jgi:hypothetical protein
MADFVLKPLSSAGLTAIVPPEVLADVYTLVLVDPLIANITGITSQLIKERFLIIFLSYLTGHIDYSLPYLSIRTSVNFQ